MNPKCVIVPDVHGRGFWRAAKSLCPTDTPIVFLGDYLDPYGFEGITPYEAVEVFKEVIAFRKANPNVVLLLGNHDCTYFIGKSICECRCNYEQYDEIRKLFKDNAELFGIVHPFSVGKKKFILSHAGIQPKWLEDYGYTVDDIEKFNGYIKGFDEESERFKGALSAVSYYRGGIGYSASPIWADIREYGLKMNDLSAFDFYQIVGHTYIEKPVVVGKITCIDVQRIFCIGDNGKLYDYETEKEIKNDGRTNNGN